VRRPADLVRTQALGRRRGSARDITKGPRQELADDPRVYPKRVSLFERRKAGHLERFPNGLNREGFPNQQRSDSSCMLVKEASMHGQSPFG